MPPRKKSIFRRLKSVIKKEKEIIDDVDGDLENKHLEFEDDIQTNEFKKAEESEIKEIHNKKLLSLFEDMNSLFLRKRNINWEKKCWNNYIYQNYDINPLILPEVNAYLTEWDEDEMYDIIQVFRKCRQCSQMCEDIKCALLECPEPEYKVLKSCLESIRNLQCMMRKKIEIATFLILRAANQYVNDETFNMEYGIVDCFEDDKSSPPISLCLWGNLSKNVRHKGMDSSSMEFNFELPPELIKVKCAVRIMHTLFDNVTPTFCESSMPYQWNIGNSEIRKPCSETLLDEIFPRNENELLDAKNEALSTAFHAELTSAVSKQISSMESATASHSEVDKNPIVMFTPPEEPELTILEKSEYFAVGGIYHFDLFYLPYPTVKAGSWIFSHCEEKVLRHIPYQTSIIPIRHPKPDMSPALAAEFADSEIKRFDKEMCSAISLTLKVPDDVLFLEQPLPAFWVNHKKGFTSIGFFETKYDEDTGHISFKTNRFGVIALLQRRYNNMPYQSWELISGNDENSASLAITGMHVALKIKIKSGKCCIENIEQDGKSLFSDVYDIWMNPNLLVKKLLSMGININVERDIEKYLEISTKDPKLEHWIYSCISVLCHVFNFSCSRFNSSLERDQCILKYSHSDSQAEIHHLLLTPEKAVEIKCSETQTKFCDEPVENQKFYSDLYQIVTERCEEPFSLAKDCAFVNSVYFLLSSCKLLSCS